MKRVSLDLPDEWLKAIKQAALDADFNSSAEYIRHILDQSPDIRKAASKAGIKQLPSIGQSWGGQRGGRKNKAE